MLLNPNPITGDPDLQEMAVRLAEAKNDLNVARAACQRLLSNLTDALISVQCAERALNDYDTRDRSHEGK